MRTNGYWIYYGVHFIVYLNVKYYVAQMKLT